MFKPINKMFEPIIRMAAAALVAGVIAFAITAAPAANDGAAKSTPAQPFAKADRLPVPGHGARCSKHRRAPAGPRQGGPKAQTGRGEPWSEGPIPSRGSPPAWRGPLGLSLFEGLRQRRL